MEKEGRRYIFWRKRKGLENNLTEQFMGKIRDNVRTAVYLRHNYSYWLKTSKTGLLSCIIKTQEVHPWITGMLKQKLVERKGGGAPEH